MAGLPAFRYPNRHVAGLPRLATVKRFRRIDFD